MSFFDAMKIGVKSIDMRYFLWYYLSVPRNEVQKKESERLEIL